MKTFRQKQCGSAVKFLLTGVEVGPYDICILNGDNIGFHKKGPQVGYSNWILFQDIILRRQRLEEIKIYSDTPSERLSREPEHD